MARRTPAGPKGSSVPEYMATYGDLVTLLLCFFVFLYAVSDVNTEKLRAVADSFSGGSILASEPTSKQLMEMMGNGIIEFPNAKQGEGGDSDSGGKGAADEAPEAEPDLPEPDLSDPGLAELARQKAVIAAMASDFKSYFAKDDGDGENLGQYVEIEQHDLWIDLRLLDQVVFESGSANIRPEALPLLDAIADELIKTSGYTLREFYLEIEGHTDNRPINTLQFKNNFYLSSARAIEVMQYFSDVKGLDPEKMTFRGFGDLRPIASNDTPEGRAQNRRVQLRIVNEKLYETEGVSAAENNSD